jgi:hypothetical protein
MHACAGARALCCRAAQDAEALLGAAPRCALHAALAGGGPGAYLGASGAQEDAGAAVQMGASSDMEDAAIAYRLLLEVGAS